jgi:hypothetical protein
VRRRTVTTEATRAARTEARLRELDRSFNRVVGRQGDGGDGGGPAGPPGDDGAPGVSVTSATVNGSGHLILTQSTGATIDAGVVVGATGATGPTGATGATGAAGASPVSGPEAELIQTAAQSLANNAWTAIALQGETVDTHNGHDTATNNSRFTIPAGWAGYYVVSGLGYFASGTAGVRVVALAKNGTRIRGALARDQPAGDGFGNGVSTGAHVLSLAVGDYVELHVLHTQGAAINTFAGDPETSSLTVAWLRA